MLRGALTYVRKTASPSSVKTSRASISMVEFDITARFAHSGEFPRVPAQELGVFWFVVVLCDSGFDSITIEESERGRLPRGPFECRLSENLMTVEHRGLWQKLWLEDAPLTSVEMPFS